MNNPKMQRQQTVLTADGELQDVEMPVSDVKTIYCIHCGTANRSIATFCRNCGQPLDEELDTYTGTGRKSKRREVVEHSVRSPMSVPAMVFSVIKAAIVGGIVMQVATNPTNGFGSYVLAGFFILGWIITEAAQHGALNSK